MKKWVIGSTFAAIVAIPTTLYSTGFPVVDAASIQFDYVNWLAQFNQMVDQIENQVSQIEHQVTQIGNQQQTLETLTSGDFGEISDYLLRNAYELNRLINSVKSISYDVQSIQDEFDTLFPEDWESIDIKEFEPYFKKWNTELTDASRVAMESQAIINTIEENNETAESILAKIPDAAGEVRQLQSTNEMLALVNNNLGTITQTLVTSGRVSATLAAQTAAEKAARKEAGRRAIANYTDLGKPANILEELP